MVFLAGLRPQRVILIGEAPDEPGRLLASIVAARPGRGDIVYLERHGDEYDWRLVTETAPSTTTTPDVWMSFSAAWPLDDQARLQAFFDRMPAATRRGGG